MSTLKSPNKGLSVGTESSFTNQLNFIIPRQNGTPAGLLALQASLLRGKGLTK